MRVSHVGFADFFTHGHHDALPAHHGAQAEGDGHGDLHPQRNKACGIVDLLLEQLQLALGISVEIADLVLVHQANGFAGQVHVVTHVAYGFGGDFGQGAVAFYFITDLAGEGSEGRHQFWRGFLGTHVGREDRARITRQCLRRVFYQGDLGHFGHRRKLQ